MQVPLGTRFVYKTTFRVDMILTHKISLNMTFKLVESDDSITPITRF